MIFQFVTVFAMPFRFMVGLLLLAGCASGSVASGSDQTGAVRPEATARFLAQVHARTDAANSASYAWELRLVDASASWGDSRGGVVMQERGAYDRAGRRLMAETTSIGPDGQPSGAPLRVVVDGGDLYVQPGYLSDALGVEPGDWIGTSPPSHHADPSGGSDDTWDAGAPAGIGRRGVGLGGLLGPLLGDVTGDVVIVGDPEAERVRGVPTTHLRARAASSALSGAVDHPGLAEHAHDVTIDAWVDREGRARRVEADAGAFSLRVDLFDYDAPVEIEIPDESQIVLTHSELLGQVVARFGAG
jgi:hypothetical protein